MLGKKGEEIVAKKLASKGYTILHTNYTRKYGEIDVIAQKGTLLLFIEVKMRKNPLFELEYLITPSKQKKIIATAKAYIAQYNHYNKDCRFDVALIVGTEYNYKLRYIANAFGDPHG